MGSACGPPQVPLIDLAPFLQAISEQPAVETAELPEGARDVVRQWGDAFKSLGFAQVVGHGVPDAAIEDAYSTARAFFDQPPEKKRKCDLGKGYGAGGYTAQGGERVSATASKPDGSALLGAEKSRPPDRVESMIVHRLPGDVIPESVEGYKDVMYRYHDELKKLLLSG